MAYWSKAPHCAIELYCQCRHYTFISLVRRPTSPHQQPGPTYTVHSRTNTTRLTTIPGHPCHHRTRQHLQHHSLQEAYPHRSISTLVQQPPHHSQTKCLQHPSTQGQNSIFHTGQNRQEIPTHKDNTNRKLQHIRTALQHCQFPEWTLNQWQHKFTHPNQPNTTTTTNNNNNNSPVDNKRTSP